MSDYTVDDWCNYGAFGMDVNYKEQPEYIKAQEFWLDKKAELLEEYKYCNPSIAKFIESITVMRIHDSQEGEPAGLYKISLIVNLFYDTRPGETKYNIISL
jgi:hypothetical protein